LNASNKASASAAMVVFLDLKIVALLKESRDFGLKEQMTRAAVSIASNIAEGAERDSKPEFIRFLHIARGSTAEFRTQVYIANRIRILQDSDRDELVAELEAIWSTLHALIKSLKKT
jgi:four helix bundle protein